jgi:hypothetical protein
MAEAGTFRNLGERPVAVLTHIEPLTDAVLRRQRMSRPEVEKLRSLWLDLQNDIASWSSRSTHRVSNDAEHLIQFDRPRRSRDRYSRSCGRRSFRGIALTKLRSVRVLRLKSFGTNCVECAILVRSVPRIWVTIHTKDVGHTGRNRTQAGRRRVQRDERRLPPIRPRSRTPEDPPHQRCRQWRMARERHRETCSSLRQGPERTNPFEQLRQRSFSDDVLRTRDRFCRQNLSAPALQVANHGPEIILRSRHDDPHHRAHRRSICSRFSATTACSRRELLCTARGENHRPAVSRTAPKALSL